MQNRRTHVCNKWIWTFIHNLFLLHSILFSLLPGSLLTDANQPGIGTSNTHATEYTGVLFFICDLASLDRQARLLDCNDCSLKLNSIGQFSSLQFEQVTRTINSNIFTVCITVNLTIPHIIKTTFQLKKLEEIFSHANYPLPNWKKIPLRQNHFYSRYLYQIIN